MKAMQISHSVNYHTRRGNVYWCLITTIYLRFTVMVLEPNAYFYSLLYL